MQRVFTMTGRKDLFVLYRCEKCGEMVVQPISLEMQRRFDDTAFTRAGTERLKDANEEKLVQKLNEVYVELLEGEKTSAFPKAKLKCKCTKCHEKQSWSRLDYTWTSIGMALLGIGFVFLLAFAYGRQYLGLEHISYQLSWQCRQFLPLALAVLVGCGTAWGIHFGMMMSKIKQSFSQRSPLFGRSIAELRKRAAKYEAYSQVDWSQYEK